MTLRKKLQITIVCLSVILCTLVTGTIAWLTDETDPVTNTFTPSNIDVELSETKGGTNKEFKMVPGATIEKDPTITVAANSEACWLFVKIEKANDFDTFMEYSMADGWTALDGVAGVYYRTVAAANETQEFPVLTGNVVTVKHTVTKAMMNALKPDDPNTTDVNESTYPTLTFTAYAIQSEYLNYTGATTDAERALVAWNTLNAPQN